MSPKKPTNSPPPLAMPGVHPDKALAAFMAVDPKALKQDHPPTKRRKPKKRPS